MSIIWDRIISEVCKSIRNCRQNLHPQMQKERKKNKLAVQAYNNEGNIQVMVVA